MTNKKVKSQVKKNVINPIMAAVTGVVVAGATVAGAIIMSKKKNQDKVKKVVSDVKDNLNDKKELIVKKANKLKNITKNTIREVKKI